MEMQRQQNIFSSSFLLSVLSSGCLKREQQRSEIPGGMFVVHMLQPQASWWPKGKGACYFTASYTAEERKTTSASPSAAGVKGDPGGFPCPGAP